MKYKSIKTSQNKKKRMFKYDNWVILKGESKINVNG